MSESGDDPTIIAQLERQGEAQVRVLIASGQYPTQLIQTAVRWLAKKDQEARVRNDASQIEQNQTARSAKKAAWIAAIAAIAAAIVAIMAAVIAAIAWIYPRAPS